MRTGIEKKLQFGSFVSLRLVVPIVVYFFMVIPVAKIKPVLAEHGVFAGSLVYMHHRCFSDPAQQHRWQRWVQQRYLSCSTLRFFNCFTAGFVVDWALNYIGLLAMGLAFETAIELLTLQFLPLFLIFWIISESQASQTWTWETD